MNKDEVIALLDDILDLVSGIPSIECPEDVSNLDGCVDELYRFVDNAKERIENGN